MKYEIKPHTKFGHPTIRNICITDCQTIEDYQKIRFMCGDFKEETSYADIFVDTVVLSHMSTNHFLYDDLDNSAFLYFWTAQSMSPSTHHFMTVREFYDLFDTTTIKTPYEFW